MERANTQGPRTIQGIQKADEGRRSPPCTSVGLAGSNGICCCRSGVWRKTLRGGAGICRVKMTWFGRTDAPYASRQGKPSWKRTDAPFSLYRPHTDAWRWVTLDERRHSDTQIHRKVVFDLVRSSSSRTTMLIQRE